LLGCLLAWLLVRPSAVVLNQHTCSLYVPLCFLNICFLCNQRSTDNNLLERVGTFHVHQVFSYRDLEVYNATLYQGHSSLFSDLATSFSRHSIISCTTARSGKFGLLLFLFLVCIRIHRIIYLTGLLLVGLAFSIVFLFFFSSASCLIVRYYY
jgi:hypothetical protein